MSNVAVLRKEIEPKRQTPLRRPNRDLRSREHLTEAEVDKLIEAARGNRNGHRDATMILIAYRHGLRASELVDLRWDQVSFSGAVLRHACGYKLANDGQDTRSLQAYLGHKNIQHTVRYTELAPGRFKDFWKD